MDQKDRRERLFTSQTPASRDYQDIQEPTAHLVFQDLSVSLEVLDHSDPADILAPLVLPVLQVQWEATAKDTQERKEIRVTWVCPVRADLLVTSL